jgi:hypothetical protein
LQHRPTAIRPGSDGATARFCWEATRRCAIKQASEGFGGFGIREDELAIRRYDACEDTKNPAGGSVGEN